ncbi:MAG: sulfite reductase subunit A [Ignavibacteria bacterium]|nr:sulfite reductase subunit A [Ignavibacteria bacterium]
MERLEIHDLSALFSVLKQDGYQIIGPTVRESAIVCERIQSVDELPAGVTDIQRPASYRLAERHDNALFGHRLGPQSWKRYLYPPRLQLFQAARTEKGITISPPTNGGAGDLPKYAFVGVRPCELSAIGIQDMVFARGTYVDPHYSAVRARIIVIAVNCTDPGETCFCASMKTGPQTESGYDLALTEVISAGSHLFVAQSGSDVGKELLARLKAAPASAEEIQRAEDLLDRASEKMGRSVDTYRLPELLHANIDHPQWDELDERCLSCGNCTQVCPTCFCSTVEDVTNLDGTEAGRWRKWDSCFTLEFSYIHGGCVRATTKSRYRQWMTHKLASWVDQFGTFGCVGCGRCITWCPVGIDITEEARAIRAQSTLLSTSSKGEM